MVQSGDESPLSRQGRATLNADQPMTKLLPPPSFAKPDFAGRDIVRRFLAWAQCADAEARAQGASALARAYLHSDIPAPLRAEAVLAMTALLDDPAVLVRRALAEAMCSASEAPRPLILALAADGEPDVAAAVLQRSPVLTDADLVACAGSGDVVAQTALARRPNLPRGAIAALAETGQFDAVLALIGNAEIDIPPEALSRIFARFSGEPTVHEALLERPSLPASLRARIVVALARDLSAEAFAVDAARAGRTHRPRGARSGGLSDRRVLPSRRADGACARAARSRRADAGPAPAFAAWRRAESVR